MQQRNNGDEYIFYKQLFKNNNFESKLKKLGKKYKNKKILLYGAGLFFDVIVDNYDVKKYLNVIGISDIKYEKTNGTEYKKIKTYKPSEINELNADVILLTTYYTSFIKKHLKENVLLNDKIEIEAFNQDFFVDIVKNNFNKFITLPFFELFKALKNPFNAIKYFIFCSDEEIKAKINYAKIIEKLKQNKKDKIKVAFICHQNQKWGYQSVYEAMKKDDNFEILPIINLPIIKSDVQKFNQNENKIFFDKLNMQSIEGYDEINQDFKDLKEFKPDIVFYQQTWYIPKSQLPLEVSQYALACIITYGFFLICINGWRDLFAEHKMGNFWKIFAESKYHKKFYEKAGHFKFKDIITVTGYPKLDFYKEPIDTRYEDLWKDKTIPKKPRIIWAPHWSIELNNALRMSNFMENYKFFLDFAKNHNEYNFIYKPHPGLKYQCITEHFMSEQEYDDYLSFWDSLPNALVFDEGNYFDIFKTSDVLITDSSSFLAEYFYSKKPIIFLSKNSRSAFNSFGLELKKGFYELDSLNEMANLLKQLLIDKIDPLKPLREKIIKKNFYMPEPNIGQGIVNMLKKEIGRT